MKKLIEFIVILLTIGLVIYGLVTFRKAYMFKDIKNKMSKLENISNYYQKEDSNFENIEYDTEIIYKRLDDIIVKETSDIIIVSYDDKFYSLNKEYKFYMEIESSGIINHNLNSNEFPVDLINNSTWGLINNVEIKTTDFNGERCYELIYVEFGNTYTKYLRKEDGICMGVIHEVNGEKNSCYYITEINTQKKEDYTFDEIVDGYDKVITNTYKEPYVIRKDGRVEYIIFEY